MDKTNKNISIKKGINLKFKINLTKSKMKKYRL